MHLIRTSSSWNGVSPSPAVLEMCDAISANFAQTAAEGAWWSPWRIVSAIEAPRTLAFERRESARFNLVSLHTEKDAKRVSIPRERLLVSTQGVNVSTLPFRPPSTRTGRSIALIGKMDFVPNWHGAEWFARHVLPLLDSAIRLKVVGDCPAAIREKLEAIERVDVTGRVESLAEACSDCFAAIAPMHVATGIQNKVLEYFAMGLPSVVSESVASGLLPSAQGTCHVAANPAAWAEAVQTIEADPARADEMATRARDYVLHSHSWDQIGREYRQRLHELLARNPSTRSLSTPASTS